MCTKYEGTPILSYDKIGKRAQKCRTLEFAKRAPPNLAMAGFHVFLTLLSSRTDSEPSSRYGYDLSLFLEIPFGVRAHSVVRRLDVIIPDGVMSVHAMYQNCPQTRAEFLFGLVKTGDLGISN